MRDMTLRGRGHYSPLTNGSLEQKEQRYCASAHFRCEPELDLWVHVAHGRAFAHVRCLQAEAAPLFVRGCCMSGA